MKFECPCNLELLYNLHPGGSPWTSFSITQIDGMVFVCTKNPANVMLDGDLTLRRKDARICIFPHRINRGKTINRMLWPPLILLLLLHVRLSKSAKMGASWTACDGCGLSSVSLRSGMADTLNRPSIILSREQL